jgi:translation initiation factor IF-2
MIEKDSNKKNKTRHERVGLVRKSNSRDLRGSRGNARVVHIEVKKKKSSGLRVNITDLSKNNFSRVSDVIGSKIPILNHAQGDLTDQEFRARVKALQGAMEKNQILASIPLETDEHTLAIDQTAFVNTQPDTITKEDEPANSDQTDLKSISSQQNDQFEDLSKQKNIKSNSEESVIHKTNSITDEVSQTLTDKKVSSAKIKKAADLVEGNRKAKTTKVPFKKNEANKKVLRSTLERILDNDLEERTRSIASLKRAKQKKLKGSDEKQDPVKVIREISIPDFITISELANRMAVKGAEVIKSLMKMGTMATLNELIDGDTAEIICSEFGHVLKRISESDIENEIEKIIDVPEDLVTRAPIIAIMGHVDHGKTTLLDSIRKTSVAATEAGGITQHIAAYQIESKNGRSMTFIDTPGHAAFSKIRSRGATITDIIVLVVAADDGIKDQTIEAIEHAKSQNVSIIVAINKIDKANTNINRIKTDLMNHGLTLEEFGGDVLSSEISALQNINMEGLIDTILLQAEMMQLKSNPDRKAAGIVLESRLEKGRGIVASIIVQHGTLKVGDIFVAGGSYGKVRVILNDIGEKIHSAGPSVPIEIIGFNSAPNPGDYLTIMDSEQKAKEIAGYRQRIQKDTANISGNVNVSQLMANQKNARFCLNVFVKADVSGSVEALLEYIRSINHSDVEVNITGSGVGTINEGDVNFAKNTRSIIVGFNVGITSSAQDEAKQNIVKIYSNNVIFDILQIIKKEMSMLLPPTVEENYIGTAAVRKIFSISRYGTIAGCYVTDGIIRRNDSRIKVLRGIQAVFEGKIKSMKHEKDEIKESKQSHECGILADGFNNFQVGDKIECYEIVRKERYVE